jgi:hypothetical protein
MHSRTGFIINDRAYVVLVQTKIAPICLHKGIKYCTLGWKRRFSFYIGSLYSWRIGRTSRWDFEHTGRSNGESSSSTLSLIPYSTELQVFEAGVKEAKIVLTTTGRNEELCLECMPSAVIFCFENWSLWRALTQYKSPPNLDSDHYP